MGPGWRRALCDPAVGGHRPKLHLLRAAARTAAGGRGGLRAHLGPEREAEVLEAAPAALAVVGYGARLRVAVVLRGVRGEALVDRHDHVAAPRQVARERRHAERPRGGVVLRHRLPVKPERHALGRQAELGHQRVRRLAHHPPLQVRALALDEVGRRLRRCARLVPPAVGDKDDDEVVAVLD